MTKGEFLRIAAIIRTSYPQSNAIPNDQALSIWHRLLQDIPYPVAEAVTEKWCVTNHWPPAISDIREEAAKIMSGNEQIDWSEAWDEAIRLIGRYGFYQRDECYAAMRPLTRETVQRTGWDSMCHSENLAVERANFRQIYEALSKREAQSSQIPLSTRQNIAALAAQFLKSMPELEEGERERLLTGVPK